MNTGAAEQPVSDFEDEPAATVQVQAPSVSLLDGEASDNSAHEEFDTRLQEPLVAAVGDKPMGSEAASSRKHSQRVQRKTLLLIFGQLLAALALAIGHFLFFSHLDERLVEEVSVSQSWVTASSLFLVTLVKGALTVCVGTCFVQHLWAILQEEYTSLKDIERMFNLRGSVLAILDPRAFWKAPLLFFMGAYLWLLTVALIYPPGALIVSMDARHSIQSLNMSVLNQSFPDTFDPLDFDSFDYPGLSQVGLHTVDIEILNSSAAQISYRNNVHWGLKGPMISYATFILSAGQISRIEPPHSRNSSYVLEYDAPQLNCTESDSNTTIYAPFDSAFYNSDDNLTTSLRSYDLWNFRAGSDDFDTFSIDFARYLGYIPQRDYNLSINANNTDTQFGVAMQIHTLTCKGYSAVYRVHITNQDGSQNLTYTVQGNRVLNAPGTSFSWTAGENGLDTTKDHPDFAYLRSIVPRQLAGYREWASRQVPEYLRAVNALNLFEYALGSIEGYHGTWIDLNVTQGVQCIKNGWFVEENGTQVDLCPLDPFNDGMGNTSMPEFFFEDGEASKRSFNNDLSPIQASALNMRRFDGLERDFNPLADLNITSASLNELLANFSISALTQNTFFDNVPVDIEEYRNVYHFADKVGFCVPYALCLAIALVYALIALRALRKNGMPAADGGFLQVMMTTRGDTEMERLVVERGPKSVEDIEGELAGLRVRLEEVTFEREMQVGDEEGPMEIRRRLAFRTEGEDSVGRRL